MKWITKLQIARWQLVLSVAGVLAIGVSIGALKAAGMGTDPLNVLMSGLADVFHIGYTALYIILNAAMLLLALLLNRGWIGIVTVLTLTCNGFIAQHVCDWLSPYANPSASFIIVPVVIAFLLLQCLGVSLCIVSRMGVGPYDAVYLILSERLHLSIRACRVALDLICVVAGLLIGGTAGFVTALAVLCMGPAINILVKTLGRIPAIKKANCA